MTFQPAPVSRTSPAKAGPSVGCPGDVTNGESGEARIRAVVEVEAHHAARDGLTTRPDTVALTRQQHGRPALGQWDAGGVEVRPRHRLRAADRDLIRRIDPAAACTQ